MSKRIRVVHAEGDIPDRLKKVFPSYAALMRRMEIGATVTVSVSERIDGNDMLLGYDTVERTKRMGYTKLRQLQQHES